MSQNNCGYKIQRTKTQQQFMGNEVWEKIGNLLRNGSLDLRGIHWQNTNINTLVLSKLFGTVTKTKGKWIRFTVLSFWYSGHKAQTCNLYFWGIFFYLKQDFFLKRFNYLIFVFMNCLVCLSIIKMVKISHYCKIP